MRALLANRWLLFVSRIVLGTVFVVASIDKIAVPDAFAESILAYGIVPYPLVNVAALLIPWLELVCGVLLLCGVRVRPSAAIVTALLAVFIVAISSALLRELKIDCGCFGKDHLTPVSWMKVAEDTGLLLLGIHAFLFSGEKASQEAPGPVTRTGEPP
jgi:putative oxidoreductase